MGVIKFGILFFFCFLLELTCDASNPIPSGNIYAFFFFFQDLYGSHSLTRLLFYASVHDNQVCELCDKYLTLAIDYLQNEDNQNAFVEALHMTCSQIPPLQKQAGPFSFFLFYYCLLTISLNQRPSPVSCHGRSLYPTFLHSSLPSQAPPYLQIP